jgi:hypothetical protein
MGYELFHTSAFRWVGVAVLTAEGGYFKANFDKGGEMEKMQYVKFIRTPGEPA